MWTMGLLFLKTFPVKQYPYENDFSGVFDALHQSFLISVLRLSEGKLYMVFYCLRQPNHFQYSPQIYFMHLYCQILTKSKINVKTFH